MRIPWPDRALGWGVSLALHALGIAAACLLALPDCGHWHG
jgi:hypothetical protein